MNRRRLIHGVDSENERPNSHFILFCRQFIKPGVHCFQTKDCKGGILVDFVPKGTTLNANCYCETLRKLRQAIQNRRRGISGGIVLLHDNPRPHTAAATQELLDQFGWEIFDHPPYSPDLAPSDFHLFLKLKEFLGGKRFGRDEELENAVTTWLNELAAKEYDMRILKLVDRYDKCLNVGGDYVEK
ncbi:Histone-lysine N-methyltransferase SETMAR [Araneus ventricosus]|uniref:Histone-lysine N-methyltransferase SETMAR n=1 Tax=Araneus ventricosus TaxID=182803 RepID=A0A4Y2GH47_ARAVE|nr:Histone-lysine N-methyltransferase SETMAR [Araneus ventricosus]